MNVHELTSDFAVMSSAKNDSGSTTNGICRSGTGAVERDEGRHDNAVELRLKESVVTAVLYYGASGDDEFLDQRIARIVMPRFYDRRLGEAGRQTIALGDVEHGVGLEKPIRVDCQFFIALTFTLSKLAVITDVTNVMAVLAFSNVTT
jgi:hypothetical protein